MNNSIKIVLIPVMALLALTSLNVNAIIYTNLHNFAGQPAGGRRPYYGTPITDGTKLYGMTYSGGVNDDGAIFKCDKDGGNFVLLHSFELADVNNGDNPYGDPVLIGNKLYGMTGRGGLNDDGVIFSIDTDGNNYGLLHTFDQDDKNNGGRPRGSFLFVGNKLYGMTELGGTTNKGTIFEIETNGSNFSILHSFNQYDPNNGNRPYANHKLILAGNRLFGMTRYGGSPSGLTGDGVIFGIDTNGNNFGYADDEIFAPVQITEDIFHYASHEGINFSASAQGAGDLHICFTTGTTIPFHLLWSFGGIGACKLNIYEGSTFQAGGSDQVVYCQNRVATMMGRGTSACKAGQTATAGNVQVGQAPSSAGTQINPQGFFSAKGEIMDNASHEICLELNTNYYFHLEELSASAQNGMTLLWFEVPLAS